MSYDSGDDKNFASLRLEVWRSFHDVIFFLRWTRFLPSTQLVSFSRRLYVHTRAAAFLLENAIWQMNAEYAKMLIEMECTEEKKFVEKVLTN